MIKVWLALLLCSTGALAQEVMVVVEKHADAVSYYETDTGKHLETIKVGTRPHEIALSLDRRLAYVTNYGVERWTQTEAGGNTISVIDLHQARVVGEIDLGKFHRPHGIEMSRTGRLYVVADFPPALLVIDPKAKKILREIPLGQSSPQQPLPHMVTVTGDERKAYTADAGAGTVTVVSLAEGKAVKHISIGGVPMGLALSKDERRLYAVNRAENHVLLIDTAKNEVVQRVNVPGQPVRCHLTPDEKHLIVTLIESGEAAVLTADTLREVKRLRVGANAEGIGLDPAGRFLYASAQGDNKVVKYSLRDWRPVLEIKTAARPDPTVFFTRPQDQRKRAASR
jgi:YVTN family beta-propeller protein